MEHLDDLIDADGVAQLMHFRGTTGVRTLVSRGELDVAARGARNRALFRRADVLALMKNRAALYARQRSARGAKQ